MAHSLHHAESSARKFGGTAADYIAIHSWMDGSKAHLALPGHRAMRHHTAGIFDAEDRFGVSVTNSLGRQVPVRFIAEQHVREDCRCIPTVGDWLRNLPIEPWMVNGVILPDVEVTLEDASVSRWRADVAAGQTILGYRDWLVQHTLRAASAEAAAPVAC
jgi:hypothetical protein